MRLWLAAVLAVAVLLAGAGMARAGIDINIGSLGGYAGGVRMQGVLVLDFDQYIDQGAFLITTIDGSPVSSMPLQGYILDPEFYGFKPVTFDYNLTRSGTNTWTEKPQVTFNYVISASGTQGNPPTGWSTTGVQVPGSVSNKDGLKFIKDGNSIIFPPPDNNNDTAWSVTDNSQQVDTTMSQACGGQVYATQLVDSDGWIRRTLLSGELQGLPPTDCQGFIEPFSGDSLGPSRQRFIDRQCQGTICGGIYKDTGSGAIYQNSPGQVEWAGETGHVVIHNCDLDAAYFITYLPPNGPNLCAYTAFVQQNSASWAVSAAQNGNAVEYSEPFVRQYSQQEIAFLIPPPSCPAGTTNCVQSTSAIGAALTKNPTGTVSISFNQSSNTTTATTTSTSLSSSYTAGIGFGDIPNLASPTSLGPHDLGFRISYQGATIASNTTGFVVCIDGDGDGYCTQGGDCSDTDPSRNPSAAELCNLIDDNCNNQTDEDFQIPGKLLGTACNNWAGSACSGLYSCSQDGLSVMCGSAIQPGEKAEICSDHLDNDCDGVIDELAEVGVSGLACSACNNGETRPCGGQGVCGSGISVCANGQWGSCSVQSSASAEICNTVDDNCDGIIDNIGADFGMPGTGSACRCSGGGQPSFESCNEVDDDCNGLVDDGVSCCSNGDTRSCGSDIGTCSIGTQSCFAGSWGSCSGSGPEPLGDICGDGFDNDCDGSADEACESCSNGVADMDEEGVDCGGHCGTGCGAGLPLFVLFIPIGIIIVATVLFLRMKGRL